MQAKTEQSDAPAYLAPYRRAVARHGAGFESLLWASPKTQAARFEAMRRLCDFRAKTLLDVGCGRADLLDYLAARGAEPADYIGIEAVGELADAAEAKRRRRCTIVRADFVREPARMFAGADAVVFCGSLNTLDAPTFDATLRRGFEAAAQVMVFNFLCSPLLAGREYLTWHREADVMAAMKGLGGQVRALSDYMPGDCTMAVYKVPHRITGGESLPRP